MEAPERNEAPLSGALPKAEVFTYLRTQHGDIEGLERSTDALLERWNRSRSFVPGPTAAQREYLTWLALRIVGATERQRRILGEARASPPPKPGDSVWDLVADILHARMQERTDVFYANAESNTGAELAAVMEAERLRQRDWIRTIAALKRAQVDMADETGRVSETQKEAQRVAFKVRNTPTAHPRSNIAWTAGCRSSLAQWY